MIWGHHRVKGYSDTLWALICCNHDPNASSESLVRQCGEPISWQPTSSHSHGKSSVRQAKKHLFKRIFSNFWAKSRFFRYFRKISTQRVLNFKNTLQCPQNSFFMVRNSFPTSNEHMESKSQNRENPFFYPFFGCILPLKTVQNEASEHTIRSRATRTMFGL